jgi:hypothetical protein
MKIDKTHLETGKGWDNLVIPLVELCELRGVEVLQIKEKFGTLRFYIGASDSSLDAIISAAEAASGWTCEDCGEDNSDWEGHVPTPRATTSKSETSNWLRTLCAPCRKAWDEERVASGRAPVSPPTTK